MIGAAIVLVACTPPGTPPSPSSTTSPPATSPTTIPTGPAGWEHLRLYRPGLAGIEWEGATGWAIDGAGGVLDVATWTELGGSLDRLTETAEHDGVLWATTWDTLVTFDGADWVTVALLPAELQGPSALVARADGTVVVLAVEQPLVDCYDSCPPSATNLLATWDGVAFSVDAVGPAHPMAGLTETSDGRLVGVDYGGGVVEWDGAAWIDHFRGEILRAVAADGAGGVVAVGDEGATVRGPLTALVAASPAGEELAEVSVGDDGTAWALGVENAWVDDGGGWVAVPLARGDWFAIAAGPDGVQIGGDDGGPTALAGDQDGLEVAWHADAVYRPGGLWMDAEGTTWVGASDGHVGRWDSTFEVWTLPGVDYADLDTVSGAGPDDVVAAGWETLASWDGATWTVAWSEPDASPRAVSVAPDGAAYAAGFAYGAGEVPEPLFLRRDGASWVREPAPLPVGGDLVAVHAVAADDVYALASCDPCALLHWDGVAWSQLGPDLHPEGYGALWGRSGSDLYLGRSGSGADPLLWWDGATFTAVVGGPLTYVNALAGDASGLIVAGKVPLGDDYEVVAASLRDGVWTELFREEGSSLTVIAHDDLAVIATPEEAWRGSW